MNLTAETAPSGTAAQVETPLPGGWRGRLAALALPLLAVVVGLSSPGKTVTPAALLAGAVGFFLTMYAYYAIARLMFEDHFGTILLGVLVAAIYGVAVTPGHDLWRMFLSGFGLVATGLWCGHLVLIGKNTGGVFIGGAMVVVFCHLVQYAPLWSQLLAASEEAARSTMVTMERVLTATGYDIAANREALDRTAQMLNGLARLTPATLVLSALMQFAAGFAAFTYLVARAYPGRFVRLWVPFDRWRATFALTPLLVLALLGRLLGGDAAKLVADNILASLAVVYAVTGLGFMEFYLKHLQVSTLLKVVFYLALFLSQFVGFFAAALLGFADSFADWRGRTAARTT